MGDELLIALSQRMKHALREGDTLPRFGGVQFVAVLAVLANVEDCELFLNLLLKAATYPVTVGDTLMQLSASIRVAIYPEDNVDADQYICVAK